MRHGIGEIKLGRETYILLPFSTLRYAIVGCFLLLLLACATEFFSQRECAIGNEGYPASYCPEWKAENKIIGRLLVDRIIGHNTDVIWQSALLRPPQNLSAERKRILVIGDSFVEGDGLSNVNVTWWRELQREIERRGYWNVDVIAAGRNGASTQTEAEWVERWGIIERYKPDVVILGFVTNDPDVTDANGKSLVRQFDPDQLTNCLPVLIDDVLEPIAPRLYSRMLDDCRDRTVARKEAKGEEFRYDNWVAQLYRPENMAAYAPIVRRFIKEQRSKVPNIIAVALVTQPREVLNGPIYRDVGPLFSQSGARWVDLGERYLRRFGDRKNWKPGMFANPANAHPGPILTRFYATEIADLLELEYLSVLGPRGPMPSSVRPSINDAVPASIELNQDGLNSWSFHAIDHDMPALKWPISMEHAQLSFERPVAADGFTFRSPSDMDICLYGHFIDETDGHVEVIPRFIGRGRGQVIKIEMPEALRYRRLMSLRIVAEETHRERTIEWELPLAAGKIVKEDGKAYTFPLEGIPYPGADSASPNRQILSLFENETKLALGASIHAEIRNKGSGRYSHWESALYFSTTDNSDPRTNGRTYRLRKFVPPPRVSMVVQFGAPSVLP